MLRYLFVLFLFSSHQLSAQNSFLIQGTFKDYNGVIYLKYNNKADSALIKNGLFTFKGDINSPVPASVFIKDVKPVYSGTFVLEPGELSLQVDSATKVYDGLPVCRVFATAKGGRTNALLNSFENVLISKSSAMKGKTAAEKRQVYITELKVFVTQHPREFASLILVEQAYPGFSQHELVAFYQNLPAVLKSSYYGIRLKAAIDKNNQAQEQTTIKDFAQLDANSKLVSIRSLRGKVVLIDFWASWCIPCREQNPNLLRMYEKYKSKGFEILAVSLDADRQKWLSAIKHDQLNWLNVSDLKGTNNEVALMFNIGSIPDNILIDREGRVIAKKVSSEELEQMLNKVL